MIRTVKEQNNGSDSWVPQVPVLDFLTFITPNHSLLQSLIFFFLFMRFLTPPWLCLLLKYIWVPMSKLLQCTPKCQLPTKTKMMAHDFQAHCQQTTFSASRIIAKNFFTVSHPVWIITELQWRAEKYMQKKSVHS